MKTVEEFHFCEQALAALSSLATLFDRIVVVTNQQGIGKGLMTEEMLLDIHGEMLSAILANNGRIDAIYYCPHLASFGCNCRKPGTGMPQQAKAEFPDIDFSQSIMVGDSITDMQMGRSLGMYCVWINADHRMDEIIPDDLFDLKCSSLAVLAEVLTNQQQ